MVLARFLAGIAAEEDRWPLWLPVALGLGAACYFALSAEPPGWILPLGLGLALAATGAAFRLRGPGFRALLSLAAMLALGFSLAKGREMRVAAPLLGHAVTAHLTGRVESAERRPRGVRVVLADVNSGAFAGAPPSRVRLSFARNDDLLAPGAAIGITAGLLPPPAPAEPGAADYGRADFFQRVGAVGFAYGAPYPSLAARSLTFGERLSQGVERLRARMTARIAAVLPGSVGAIATALITGTRGAIDPDDEEALRDAGLAHVLAIAGLHMGLVGGGLFWLLRAVLAAFPPLALRYPIKKWAAAGALALSAFYLVISGAAPSAVRAFVMLATALAAILLDRPALSMRSLALAAAILLALRPESITESGFQMSFAAVAALVAVAEWEQGHKVRRGRAWRYLHGILLTSLVASLATVPFALFHFGRATHYAVLGNLLAMPVMGFVVMPSAALGVAAMPLGLEALPLQAMGWGIGLMLALGRFVSGLPGAVSHVAQMPVAALAWISFGGLWLALWRKRLRWLGMAAVLAGVLLALAACPADILVGADARTVALRGVDGRLGFAGAPKDRFTAMSWLSLNGEEGAAVSIARCDGLGCVARTPSGLVVAVGRRPEALAEDCRRAAIIVNAAAHAGCPPVKSAGVKFAAGLDQARRDGGYAIRLAPLRVTSVRESRGMRPWAP